MTLIYCVIFFNAGFLSCWNFMRSAYVYPALTPGIYMLDFAVAVIQFAMAWLACWVISQASA